MSAVVREQLRSQAATSPTLGSPFTGALCGLLADRLDHSSAFGRRILDWPGNPHVDALALRACGALHALARSGREPSLAAAYPPMPFDPDVMWAAIEGALKREDAFLTAFLDSPPQTNEIARSSMILGAALHVAARWRCPLALYEIGSSAGLNLAFERYRYDFGNGLVWGDESVPLVIRSEWRGRLPPVDAPLEVASRKGCDRNPLDPANPADANRLMAYIWADQTHRLERTAAALELAAAEGRKAERIDAAEWLEREMAAPVEPGICRFLFHTIVWQYLSPDSQQRGSAAIARAAEAATEESPMAHFAVETDNDPNGGVTGAPMTLAMWPGGEKESLGRADYHGRWVDWGLDPRQIS
jgi:hypothetical protein